MTDALADRPAFALLHRACCAFLLIGGVAWALDLFLRLGVSLIEAEWLGPYLGAATAAAFLQHPYRRSAGAIDALAAVAALACWSWLGWRYGDWLIDYEGFTAEKYVPGAIGIVLMTEALRKSCGPSIAVLVWALVVYALLGNALPPPWQADRVTPQELVTYLYTDANAIPGLVLVIIASLVLAFIVLGKLMEVSGATGFFTDLAMALMGGRRGGPAKVSVVASSMMGSITSSPVGNIMSTGVVTIPLMKKTGFRAADAAAVEGVASTGGQITPPVMGATAFLMAEFLNVDYADVVKAALLPALFFYVCLLLQVDAIAARNGLTGLPRSALPAVGATLRRGWIFVLPLGVLVFLLFWANTPPASAALTAAALLLGLALVRGRFRSGRDWYDLIVGGGRSMVPLVMIAAGAGVVIGVMNISGFGQSLAFVLVELGSAWGLFPMLLVTAFLSIVLGMGMPSTAIYVVLASLIAPALVELGVTAMAAHFFIFYFGVLSFLTPPVAVSSYVAAGLAGANMWQTSWLGMRLAAVAYLLPFVWIYDPALLLDGSALGIVVVCATTFAALLLISRSIAIAGAGIRRSAYVAGLAALAVAVATAPIWIGAASPWALAAAAIGALASLPARKPSRLLRKQPD